MKISFFFPAYRDEATVEPLALLLDEVLGAHAEEHEIIVVDDGSPDRSGAIADRLARENPRIRALHHPRNLGYGQAVLSGVRAARLPWIAFTDGDMQYDVRELPRLLAKAREGYEVVAGRKERRAEGLRRSLTSYAYNAAIRACFGLGLHDADCAFKLMHRSVFEGFEPSTHYHEAFVLVEAFYKAKRRGARIAEVPVSHHPRRAGESQSFTWRTARRLAWNAARGAVVGRVLGRWQ
ncbi:MAG: glycosyltransferase family 2 protein [Myxococcales bacterium]|nr:glycosyltransferase family 2 protein [Myxococcales bacterium]